MPTLTHQEQQTLEAVKDAAREINTPSLSPSMIFDYCPPTLSWDCFADALKGLRRLGLIEGTTRFRLTTEGKEVAA